MHRAPSLRLRPTVLFLVPLTVLLALGLIFGRSFTETSTPSTELASKSLAPAANSTGSTAKSLAARTKLHRAVSGSYRAAPARHRRPTPKPTRPAPTTSPTPSTSASPIPTATTTSPPTVAPSATAAPTVAPTTAAPTTAAPTVAPTTPAPTGTTGTTGTTAGDTAQQNEVITLTNVERAKAGCGPVQQNDALTAAAVKHAQFESDNQAEGHLFPGELDLGPRFTAAGYVGWTSIGENAAGGPGGAWFVNAHDVMYGGSATKVVNGVTTTFTSQGWMQDEAHKDNILNCAFKDIGVGAVHDAAGAIWWSQDFGTKS